MVIDLLYDYDIFSCEFDADLQSLNGLLAEELESTEFNIREEEDKLEELASNLVNSILGEVMDEFNMKMNCIANNLVTAAIGNALNDVTTKV